MSTRLRANSASIIRISNKDPSMIEEESFFREIYNTTFKELKELNQKKASVILLNKNLYHQKKTLDIECEKIVSQLKEKESDYYFTVYSFINKSAKLIEIENEIKKYEEEFMKERQSISKKKIDSIQLQKSTQIGVRFNKYECIAIKKQGEELIDKQKVTSKDLENNLTNLENDLLCLQLDYRNRIAQEEKLYYQTLKNQKIVNSYKI